MDKIITAKYYIVSPPAAGLLDFPDVIEQHYAMGIPGDREQDVTNGVTVRIETLEDIGDFQVGEFCRKQSTNIPPEASADGLAPVQLGDNSGLGHMSLFVYHRPTRCLLWQHNQSGAKLHHISVYLSPQAAIGVTPNLFSFAPVEMPNAMQKLDANGVRKFIVRFAAPENLGYLDDADTAFVQSAEDMREAFDGNEIEISISVGRKRDPRLDKENVIRTVNNLVGNRNVSVLRAITDGEQEDKMLDFLNEHLLNKGTIEDLSNDPVRNYNSRKSFMLAGFRGNLEYVKERFLPEN